MPAYEAGDPRLSVTPFCTHPETNQGPPDLQSIALPTERLVIIIAKVSSGFKTYENKNCFLFENNLRAVQSALRVSIVVSISACHADDPGSIPGRGMSTRICSVAQLLALWMHTLVKE